MIIDQSSPELSRATWRKSRFSANQGNCIEVADGLTNVVPVRDSKDPNGPALVFPADAWTTFITSIKTGEFPNT
ncbi:regulatory protein [Streptomyces rubellomurinus subsp. indigoferus]|uniref:Regulatory protein n=1 Tax=Streptomyces rubellomurinus (strain ATCC 31215) TaxID=359131 RepID=A0A0F2T712_STRR3|nr:DUF397 domain-containing protein [Streptomyces rubellomurinus]KJS52266.1 regulatory protein [Streptomyces rubellomurinus subsp. indigoferus]KJS58115.1 regulatory protein [Streptomyces rubellomurinus]